MGRINYIAHKGKTIIYVDLSKCKPKEILYVTEEEKKIVAHQSSGSVLTLTDVTDMFFDKTTSKILKDLATHNRLYAIAEAVIGVGGMLQSIYDAIVADKKNKIKLFKNKEIAKDWLVEQPVDIS